jgi:hypothetical protein
MAFSCNFFSILTRTLDSQATLLTSLKLGCLLNAHFPNTVTWELGPQGVTLGGDKTQCIAIFHFIFLSFYKILFNLFTKQPPNSRHSCQGEPITIWGWLGMAGSSVFPPFCSERDSEQALHTWPSPPASTPSGPRGHASFFASFQL